jgi:hypothetical protein
LDRPVVSTVGDTLGIRLGYLDGSFIGAVIVWRGRRSATSIVDP